MAEPDRRLTDAYVAVKAAGFEAADAAAGAAASVRLAHAAFVTANDAAEYADAAARRAADARRIARQVSQALGAVLDILDADEGVAT